MARGYRYPLAADGAFATVQGEGALLGVPTLFLRLAGCSVGCAGCDTDYRVSGRLTLAEVVERVQRLPRLDWVWLTGGEPTDHPLGDLVAALRGEGYRVALATAGVRAEARDGWPVREGLARGGVDFLSVSPHHAGDRWVVRGGSQVNLVPGLNGLRLADFDGADFSRFNHRYVTPVWYGPGARAEAVRECSEWVAARRGWRLGVQAHKVWGLA